MAPWLFFWFSYFFSTRSLFRWPFLLAARNLFPRHGLRHGLRTDLTARPIGLPNRVHIAPA